MARQEAAGAPSAAEHREATVTQPLTPVSLLHTLRVTPTPHRAVVRPGARDVSAEMNLASDSLGTESLLQVLLWHCPGESPTLSWAPACPPAQRGCDFLLGGGGRVSS